MGTMVRRGIYSPFQIYILCLCIRYFEDYYVYILNAMLKVMCIIRMAMVNTELRKVKNQKSLT